MHQPTTERSNERFQAIETQDDAVILGAILDVQAAAVEACRAAMPALARAAGLLAAAWRGGGRIVTAGAGSSGIIGLLDALELPGTYGFDGDRLPVLLAGGTASLTRLDGLSEDDRAQAAAAVAALALGARDVMIVVSASGSTPYTVAAAEAAKAAGAKVVSIACNGTAPLLDLADVAVAIRTPPEIVAGSTRMGAGTAQKCALNMLSTLTAMRLDAVHDGMMVDVKVENEKLRGRAARIVSTIAGVPEAAGAQALAAAGDAVKPAVLVARGLSPEAAARTLAAAGGNLRAALSTIEDRPRGASAG